MKIIICCATSGELKEVKTSIKNLNLKTSLDIQYLCTGTGNYETIYNLTNFFSKNENNNEIFLVHIGICGYQNIQNQDSCIQIGRIKNIITDKELLPTIPFEFSKITTVYNQENITKKTENILSGYIDTESWGIEFVCDKLGIPRIYLKVPYNNIGNGIKNFDNETTKILSESINYNKLITTIIEYNKKNK